ncbi:MAG: metallophosphoesterase [Pseudomonadota bacterium]|nr:metallophosphoesterase [Pseudomonadota bacterium]MEE3098129.1 metallophosphoesterase [Pseudomonadota bacterium]
MTGFFRRLFGGGGDDAEGGRKPARHPRGFDAPLEIDLPTYAIGDVHGRDDLLARLLATIEADAAGRGFGRDWRLVLMGDYVDRGEGSAQVLARVRGLLEGDGPAGETHALRGNHEAMMAAFAEDPAAGPRWLRNGGLQTMVSYGVGGVELTREDADLTASAAALARAAAPDLAMIAELPVFLRFGTVLFSHAGADPELPPDLQSERTLIWGTPRFFQETRRDGLWCVYGHYIVDEAHVAQGRVAVDTGAYHSGVLSAVRLEHGAEPAFLTT